MTDPAPRAGTGGTPPAPRRRRGARTSLFVAALVAALALAGYVFFAGDAGVEFAVRELALRSGGRLAIEGASGSLLDAVRVRRIVWRGPAAQATATDVTLTWSPTALWSRGVVVQTLGAQHLEIDLEASNTAVPLPASLALAVRARDRASRRLPSRLARRPEQRCDPRPRVALRRWRRRQPGDRRRRSARIPGR